MKSFFTSLVLVSSIGVAGLAQAAETSGSSTSAAPAAAASSQQALTHGEVRKVDLEQGKVTIKHQRIDNLDMPPMTMVFKVTDPASLNGVSAGDKVEFRAESAGGAISVTELRTAK